MKLLVVVVACVVVGVNAGVISDLQHSLQSFGNGVKTTFQQLVPYTETVGKQLLKDSAKNLLGGLAKGLLATLTEQFKHLFSLGKRDVSILHTLLSESGKLKNKLHQYEELLEHEFHSVVAGGDVTLAVDRLHSMLKKVYDVVEKELASLERL